MIDLPKQEKRLFMAKYHQYLNSAKKRDLEFDLVVSDFLKYWRKPCYYCGWDGKDRKYGN